MRRLLKRQGKKDFFAVWIHSEIIDQVAISFGVRLGQRDAFGLEQCFCFALP